MHNAHNQHFPYDMLVIDSFFKCLNEDGIFFLMLVKSIYVLITLVERFDKAKLVNHELRLLRGARIQLL